MDLYKFKRLFWIAFFSSFVTQFIVGLVIVNQFFGITHPFTTYGSILVLVSWIVFLFLLVLLKKPHILFLAVASLVSLSVSTFLLLLLLGWDYFLVPRPFDFFGPLRIIFFFSMMISIVYAGLLELLYGFKRPLNPKPEEL
jgi:hypothetical protein